MPHPARHGGIVSIHVGPVPHHVERTKNEDTGEETVVIHPGPDRYAVCQDGRVLKAVGAGWKTAHHLSASVARAWPQDTSPRARGIALQANALAAHHAAAARRRESPLQRKLREHRERQAR